jgi:hypothetical protein
MPTNYHKFIAEHYFTVDLFQNHKCLYNFLT